MTRSVTRAMVGWRLLMPAHSVAFRQRDGGARAATAGVVRPGRQPLPLPLLAYGVDPGPLRLDLVAPDEQRLVAFEQVQQQSLVGDAPLDARKRVRHCNVERDLAQ